LGIGSQIRIGRDRGRPANGELAEVVTLTAHPSSILRVREASAREQAMEAFTADLAFVSAWLRRG
jgi:hypothetical protein